MELEDYSLEKLCSFKDESYASRDNGAVMRKSRFGKRIRQLDDKWSFGKLNKAGYMEFCGERVHIIVATAFHGDKPGEFHVVDHIDTNRCNNRPENLRWVTRLENALNNPTTRRKVELICGSIENFLDDPKCMSIASGNQNIEWMRTVSPEEADNCRNNLTKWAESGQVPSGKGKLGEEARDAAVLRLHEGGLVQVPAQGEGHRQGERARVRVRVSASVLRMRVGVSGRGVARVPAAAHHSLRQVR